MSVIKSSRFWLAAIIIVGVFTLAILGKITGAEALAITSGLLGGFGVAKSGGSAAIKVLLPFALVLGLASGCKLSLGAQLERGLIATQAADVLAAAALNSKCAALRCNSQTPPSACIAWLECQGWRDRYKEAMLIVRAQLERLNTIVIAAGIAEVK